METIYKYPLALYADEQSVAMPSGARPLYAAVQFGRIVLYALVDPTHEALPRKVWLIGTGWLFTLDPDAVPLGVVALSGGELMLHVFIGPELPNPTVGDPT